MDYLLSWTQSCLKNNDKENNLNQTHCKAIKHVNVISHSGDNKHKEIQELKNIIDPIMSGTEQAGGTEKQHLNK